jgi:formamidopyrimidine-DNA glycosylase
MCAREPYYRVALTVAEVFEGVAPDDFRKALIGRKLTAVQRRGKCMWLQLDGKGPMPLIHHGTTACKHCLTGAGRLQELCNSAMCAQLQLLIACML